VTFASFVAVVEDSDHWRLIKPLVYHGARDRFVVPAGFRTDSGSVPGVLTWLVPRTGKHNRACVVHDWMCQTRVVTRKDADGIFRRILRELGVGCFRRWVMYVGVRIGARLPLI
jgi:hypothetical protein